MSSTARRVIILVLVAASVTLVAPGIAGAHVRTKYRSQYRTQVKNLDRLFNVWAQRYDDAHQASDDLALTMMGISDRQTLLAHEMQAMSVYTSNLGLPAQWNLSYARTVNAIKAKARRYFARTSQQRAFKTRCNKLKAYAGMLIMLANTHVYDSFQELGVDPPDYVTSGIMLGFADADAAAGHEGFDKNLAALKALL